MSDTILNAQKRYYLRQILECAANSGNLKTILRSHCNQSPESGNPYEHIFSPHFTNWSLRDMYALSVPELKSHCFSRDVRQRQLRWAYIQPKFPRRDPPTHLRPLLPRNSRERCGLTNKSSYSQMAIAEEAAEFIYAYRLGRELHVICQFEL